MNKIKIPLMFSLPLLLQALFNLGTTVLILVCAIVSILFAYYLFKKSKKFMNK